MKKSPTIVLHKTQSIDIKNFIDLNGENIRVDFRVSGFPLECAAGSAQSIQLLNYLKRSDKEIWRSTMI